MKTDLTKIDVTDFNIKDCVFGGEDCAWIFPKLEGTSWSIDNLHFRSSIWRKSDGQLVSAGFKKFFNWEESPGVYEVPNVLHAKIRCVEKIDGSCLILSKLNGELITRTRRARTTMLANGQEIEDLKVQYPKVFDHPLLDNNEHSMLYEWVTPSNKIVLHYPEPQLFLIAVIRHKDYSYFLNKELDELAKELGVSRPRSFQYSSVVAMLNDNEAKIGEEGICVYFKDEQYIRKIKSTWYKDIHNFRNSMNLKNVVNLYLTLGMPDYQTFCKEVLNTYHWEGFSEAEPLISSICDARKETELIITGMRAFLQKLDNPSLYPTRKHKAEAIIGAYGKTSRADILFNLLDGKELSQDNYKKLLFQTLISAK